MKNLILIAILAITAVSCSLFDSEEWNERKRENAERERRCYKNHNGYVYCEDKYGNRDY